MTLKKIISTGIQICIITAIAAMISGTALDAISSIPDFNPSGTEYDFDITDIYNSVYRNKVAPRLSQEIVIVSVDDCSRDEIAHVIEIIDTSDVLAIGLDIIFPWENSGDERLINAITSSPNIVMPCSAILNKESMTYDSVSGSYFYSDTLLHRGIVNFEANSLASTIRNFKTSYLINSQDINSFPVEVVKISHPSKYEQLLHRPRNITPIYFPGVEFDIISAQEIFDDPVSISSYIKGKTIFIGDVHDGHDIHITPIDKAMPGIIVQAHIAQTIIDGIYIKLTSSFINWLIAIIICMMFIAMSFVAKDRLPNAGNIVIRVLQVFSLYIFYLIGCLIFANHAVYVDFMPALSMVALGLFAFDIWGGFVACYKYLASKFIKKP